MLDLWSDKLLNAFYLETLTFSFGKVSKMGGKTGKVLKNSKNANYFQYDIRDKNLRESTEDLIEKSFDLSMEGLDMSGALDFADYNSMSEEFSNWVPKSSSDISYLYDDLQSDIDTAFSLGANHVAIYPFIDFTFTESPVAAMPKKEKRELLDAITQYCFNK
jgi:oxygen-independent coproporphyrinogen-3 oxidase